LSPTISVAMCTFNGSQFLPTQLESIATQDRLPDELVICDDASLDNSVDIARDYERTSKFPVRVVRNQSNLGSTRNFARAISMCQSQIVALADQDDVWYRYKLQRIEAAFVHSPTLVAVFSDADLIDADSNPLGLRLWNSFLFSARERRRFADGDGLKILVKHPVVTGATMAFRRELVDLLLPIPADHVHDAWIAFLLAAYGEILPIEEPLMQYRRHGRQQIGAGQASFSGRLAQASRTGPRFYLEEIERFRELSDKLQSCGAGFSFADEALHEIERKIFHREHRAHLPRTALLRIPNVLREVVNGGYWRYSEGWQSIVKDIAGLSAER
jgi:glycosyltransferase involved in cell wall biosynthesis